MIELLKRVYPGTKKELYGELYRALLREERRVIITANPEIMMLIEESDTLRNAVLNNEVILTADGIGVIKAQKLLKLPAASKITGIELTDFLLSACSRLHKRVFLFGAHEEVLEDLKERCKVRYPDMVLAGSANGYGEDREAVFTRIWETDPDMVAVALGAPEQEELILAHKDEFTKGVFIGVGGTFDVLSGHKRRAPGVFRKLNLEWAYRLLREPKRLVRFCRYHIPFILKTVKERICG